MSPLIPKNTKRAAKRGFIRTFTQSLASFIPTSAIAISLTADWVYGALLGLGGALLTSLLAGGASYFDILSKGIPEDYDTEN